MSPEQLQAKLAHLDDTFVFEIMTVHLDDLGELASLYLDALA